MNSINLLKMNQLAFTGVKRIPGYKTGISLNEYGYGSDSYNSAMSSYGKALVSRPEDEFSKLINRIDETADNETMSLDEAVKEFSTFDYPDKKKADYVLACTYENDSTEPIINKKAVLITKRTLLDRGRVSKLEDAVRTCLDAESETFNVAKFDSLFNAIGAVKRSANLKPKNQPKRAAKFQRRVAIMEAFDGQNKAPKIAESNFKTSDLFKPLDSYKEDMIKDLDALEDVPEDLKKTMKKSLSVDDFNMRKVFSDYYSLLNDCETLDDVKGFYPDLKYTEKKPVYNENATVSTLNNRFAENNYDKAVIDILKKSYIDITPKDHIFLHFENSAPTNYRSLNNAGYEFSYPAKETLQFLDKGDKVSAKFRDMPEFDEKEIKTMANKHAVRRSNVWGEYRDMTNSFWMPVRLIKHKRLHPETSEYSTDKLVNTYLLNLYKKDKNAEYSENPLGVFDDKQYLTKPAIAVINNVYQTRFHRKDSEVSEPEFLEFASKFDKQAIGKSLEKMETNYTNTFFRRYWTKDRIDSLKNEMQNSNDLIYEKIMLKEQIQPKKVTDEDVMELIEEDLSMDVAPKVDETKAAKLRYLVSNMQNRDLKERCKTCVQSTNNLDSGYFDTVYDIVSKSVDERENLNEDKAFVLLNLHDKYINHLINSADDISEEDYVAQKLAGYQDKNGNIDYLTARKDSEIEGKYFVDSTRLLTNGEFELHDMIENNFIMSKTPDYKAANRVIGCYDSTPERFKDKFKSILKEGGDLEQFNKMVSSWNFDKPEIIIMDQERFPQKVVILPEAKSDLYDTVAENIPLFDSYLKKFYQSATHRTGDEKGQGVKNTPYTDYAAEIKIKGCGGNLRMYARQANSEDQLLYGGNDGVNVKYVFYKCDDHL